MGEEAGGGNMLSQESTDFNGLGVGICLSEQTMTQTEKKKKLNRDSFDIHN